MNVTCTDSSHASSAMAITVGMGWSHCTVESAGTNVKYGAMVSSMHGSTK